MVRYTLVLFSGALEELRIAYDTSAQLRQGDLLVLDRRRWEVAEVLAQATATGVGVVACAPAGNEERSAT